MRDKHARSHLWRPASLEDVLPFLVADCIAHGGPLSIHAIEEVECLTGLSRTAIEREFTRELRRLLRPIRGRVSLAYGLFIFRERRMSLGQARVAIGHSVGGGFTKQQIDLWIVIDIAPLRPEADAFVINDVFENARDPTSRSPNRSKCSACRPLDPMPWKRRVRWRGQRARFLATTV